MLKVKKTAWLWALTMPLFLMLPVTGAAEEKVNNGKKESPKKQYTKEQLFAPASISKLSETYGHLVYKSLENPVLKLDFDAVMRGLQNAKAGKPAPMNEQEYEETINQLQEYAYEDLSNRNLKDAEKFLLDNKKKDGVKELEAGKLQYLVLQNGTGAVVTDELMPTIKYSGQYLDGTVFGSSESSGGPLSISLKQTIPGFREGILGMKVGEKRRIFIHPELGYGTSGQLLPNSLLIFDVEVTDVKPEPKEDPKNSKISKVLGDNQVSAAESLFPDELEESDGDDDEDDDDDDSDEDDEDDVSSSKTTAAGTSQNAKK